MTFGRAKTNAAPSVDKDVRAHKAQFHGSTWLTEWYILYALLQCL